MSKHCLKKAESKFYVPMVEADFTAEQRARLDAIESAVEGRLSGKRLEHVKRVAQTSLWLASLYGVDLFDAAAAGLLHDWDKKLPADELWDVALGEGLVDARDDRIEPLLHGWTAAITLPRLFPDLPPEVFTAIERHTVGSIDMRPLDMVVYLADMIEPGREGEPLDELRSLVGEVPLDSLFAMGCRRSLEYLLERGRYVYPGGVDVWNAWCDRMPV